MVTEYNQAKLRFQLSGRREADAIHIDSIFCGFGSLDVLHRLSVTILSGESLTNIGENGC